VKVRRDDKCALHVFLTGGESRALLEELLNVPGGSRMPKLRQLCHELEAALEPQSFVKNIEKKKVKK
jgi:hypothetical protein